MCSLTNFEFRTSIYLSYFLLHLCLLASMGLRTTKVMILMRVGLLSNLNSCGFSRIAFSSTEHGAIIKKSCVGFFYYVNCMIFLLV